MSRKTYKISYEVLPDKDIKRFLIGKSDHYLKQNYGEYKIYMLNMYSDTYYQLCFSKNNKLLKLSEFKSNNVKSQLFDPELIDLQSLKTKGLDFNWYRKPQKKQLQILFLKTKLVCQA